MDRMTLKIDGMSCGHCVAAVQKALDSVEGVRVEKVTIGEATIFLDPTKANTTTITEAIQDEGYQVASAER